MTLLDLLNQDGASLKRVSGTHGGEYAGPCPSCGGTDRFHVWPEQGDGGKFWCRGCSKSGDAIQYLKDFRGLSYLEACAFLGREPGEGKRSLNWNRQPGSGNTAATWQPKESTLPGDQWSTKAGQFIEWAEQQLWTTDHGKEALSWLCDRGLTVETVKRFRLGWNIQDWFPKREAWGLPTVLKDNGKPKKLWLPPGLTIPKLTGGRIDRVRIRRPEGEPRYYLVPGSKTSPFVIPGGPAARIVVESELDAILLSQEAGDLATSIALGSAQIRPDRETAAILDRAETILVSLDSDDAGAKQAWQWWAQHFPKAKRWPVIRGKDPSEARQNGLDLRTWVMAGLSKPEPESTPVRELFSDRHLEDGLMEKADSGEEQLTPGIQTETPMYPHKCAWCVKVEACDQPARREFGRQLRHDCEHFERKEDWSEKERNNVFPKSAEQLTLREGISK